MNTYELGDTFYCAMIDHIYDRTVLWNMPKCDFVIVYCAGGEL